MANEITIIQDQETQLNARQEKFAQGLANGMSKDAAYIAAGYKRNAAGASRLSRNVKILQYIQTLIDKNSVQNHIDKAKLLEQLEHARKMAIALGQTHSAVAAILAKAKLLGML